MKNNDKYLIPDSTPTGFHSINAYLDSNVGKHHDLSQSQTHIPADRVYTLARLGLCCLGNMTG